MTKLIFKLLPFVASLLCLIAAVTFFFTDHVESAIFFAVLSCGNQLIVIGDKLGDKP